MSTFASVGDVFTIATPTVRPAASRDHYGLPRQSHGLPPPTTRYGAALDTLGTQDSAGGGHPQRSLRSSTHLLYVLYTLRNRNVRNERRNQTFALHALFPPQESRHQPTRAEFVLK